MLKKKRIATLLCIFPLIVFMLVWSSALISDFVLTHLYGEEFKLTQEKKEEYRLYDIDYFKVVEYDGEKAELYYVCGDNTSAHIVSFSKKTEQWEPESVNTIWAVDGSASEILWPYWWHFIYGGV